MPRPRCLVAVLCVAIITLGALVPGAAAIDYAVVASPWVLLPDLAFVLAPEPPRAAPEQPLALLALLPSRAPPSLT